MIHYEENRSLIEVHCYYSSAMNCFIFKFAGKTIEIKDVDEALIARAFKRALVKDGITEPRSTRGRTYMQMVLAIKAGTDKLNYVWSNQVGTLISELNELRKLYSYKG
ncbi:MAG: hypothetical protein ACRCZB_05050 [Bacteroidales bacterium]